MKKILKNIYNKNIHFTDFEKAKNYFLNLSNVKENKCCINEINEVEELEDLAEILNWYFSTYKKHAGYYVENT